MVRANGIAYEYIKDRILSGEYLPAQRLIESSLSEEIGVSRNTVRKALQRLESEKLIFLEENKGATVASLDLPEIRQYYEIRTMLEVMVVKDAALLITDKQLEELGDVYSLMVNYKAQKQYDEYSKCNLKFHQIIYSASSKTVAVEMIKEIKNQLRRFQIKTMLVPGRADNSLIEHKELYEALKARDPERAAKAISTHMDHVIGTIEEYKLLFY